MSATRPQKARWQWILARLRQGGSGPGGASRSGAGGNSGGDTVTAGKLAEELEVSVRTIHRDLDALRDDHAAPIAYDPQRHTLFLEEADWQMPLVRLTESELFHLVVAAGMAGQFRGTPIARGLKALFQKLQGALQEPVDLDPEVLTDQLSFHRGHYRPMQPGVWKVLVQGMRRQKVVRLRYRAAGRRSHTTLELAPLHLSCRSGDWYLLARYPSGGEVRTYALSRMARPQLLARTFDLQTDDRHPDAPRVFARYAAKGGRKPFQVRVRFSPQAAEWVRERIWHPSEKRQEHRDGGLTLCLPIDGDKEALAWVLRWGSQAQVLSPTWLRKRVREEARAMLDGRVRHSPSASKGAPLP